MSEKMKAWCCDRGHVMGYVSRNGSGITQLMLLRHAIDLEADEPQAPDVVATIEGITYDIRCEVCESVRTWVPGKEALRHLLEMAGRKLEDGDDPAV